MQIESISPSEVYQALDTSPEGLSQSEVNARLERDGYNRLAGGKRVTPLTRFFKQFANVMIIVLLAAAAVSATISIVQKEYADLFEAGIILFIVIANAVVGAVQEGRAESALDALKNLNKPYCKVIREGEIRRIRQEEVVVGDLVLLEAGDIVPADMRLVESASLKIEESALTGESVAVEKDATATVASDAPIGDRHNMAFSTGVVQYGRGKGVVTATGMHTEVGHIAGMLQEEQSETPLQRQLAKTAKTLSIIVLAVAALIFVVSAVRPLASGQKAGLDDYMLAFMTAVAIAVAAIPEGLPAVVTIVLAVGLQKMSKKNAIIRRLPAVETLGSCQVICTDKTGTLTLNKMTVQAFYTPDHGVVADLPQGDAERLLVRSMSLCNDTTVSDEGDLLGDPTETALVAYATRYGLEYAAERRDFPRTDEIPFDSVRKLMTTVHDTPQGSMCFVKGAPDMLLERCTRVLVGDKVIALDDGERARFLEANASLNREALRTLGVAYKTGDLQADRNEDNLVLLGLVGMIDPPREEVKGAVKECIEAGMRPVMITGDHADTAVAIARRIGLWQEGDRAVTGVEIDAMSDEELAAHIREISVFARVSPENKVRIVKAFQAMGNVVAMTGDGVNDAPSIKAADIGVGMGITGTDVSKGAADMVLADDNYVTIVTAVEEGRKIYDNIKKSVQFLLSANMAEVMCLLVVTLVVSSVLGRNMEFLTPVMILWVNLVTDSLPALALGREEAEEGIMKRPPRKGGNSLFSGKMGRDIFIQAFMQAAVCLAVYCVAEFALPRGIADHTVTMTMTFVTICFVQLFHAFNLRQTTDSLFRHNPFSNKMLDLGLLVGAALVSVVVLVPPLNVVFQTTSLTAGEWGISLAFAFAIIPMVEIQKLIERVVAKRRAA